MKYKFLFFLILLITLSSYSLLDVFYKKTYIYDNLTGSASSKTTWVVKKKKNNFVIDKIAENSTAILVYSPLFKLWKYSFSAPMEKTDYKLILEDKTIIAEGKYKGSKIGKKINIQREWIQDFNFGLKSFLNSENMEKRFVIVNPNDFSVNELIAIKKGIQKIKVNKQTYKTQEVEVTLPGFKSLFWKARISYDLSTSDLVQYKANEGPGTLDSIISLESTQ